MAASNGFTKPTSVPPPEPILFAPGVTCVSPLTRRGTGPALFVLVGKETSGCSVTDGIPTPMMKWAEEGYCVVQLTNEAFETEDGAPFETALHQLGRNVGYDFNEAVGLVCYEYGLFERAKRFLRPSPRIVGAVVYGDASSASAVSHNPIPTLFHLSGTTGKPKSRNDDLTVYEYPDQTSPRFASPSTEYFNYAAEAVSHTRNLTFLKRLMKGPTFDLEALWDEHTYYEFESRNVEDTMNTMVQEPYVNHVPTLTGGIGREALTNFYRDNFIFKNPKDTNLELISRTVGIDRVVDEFILVCTHDTVIDWLFPAVPPTNRRVEIPMMAVVNIRGDRLYHEHITWDSASALRQLGYLPEYVPYTGAAVSGHGDTGLMLRLPITGKDTVSKMKDKNSVPSNKMFDWGVQAAKE